MVYIIRGCLATPKVRKHVEQKVAQLAAWSISASSSGVAPSVGLEGEKFEPGTTRWKMQGKQMACGYKNLFLTRYIFTFRGNIFCYSILSYCNGSTNVWNESACWFRILPSTNQSVICWLKAAKGHLLHHEGRSEGKKTDELSPVVQLQRVALQHKQLLANNFLLYATPKFFNV